ncbi:MAG: type II secretion system GspH family protein [Oscillospiraceae bacterium]|nr:type II secretion system GspH family protein [Oscillospiraceae bacterium]
MNEKKKLKGFTLIELIIVLAIFSIILTLVMSFIDPVAKLMTKASVRERTAAYVDNIGEYIDNSIHYSRFIRVYEGGFCDNTDSTVQITDGDAAKALVEDMLDGAVDYNGDLIKGKVHVLKLINTPTSDCTVQGQIYESIYDFTTGIHYEKTMDDGITTEIVEKKATEINGFQLNKEVINDEHLTDYDYYYQLGFFNLDPLTDTDKYTDPGDNSKRFGAQSRSYYSRLNPLLYEKDHDGVIDDEFTMTHNANMCNLSINVVSYLKGNRETALDNNVDPPVPIQVFKSPANITSASMSLVNVMEAWKTDEVICVRLKRNESGDPELKDGKNQFVPIYPKDVKLPYNEYTASYADKTDNIYIVFITPDEIYDTNIVYKS